ncbi:MAG: transglutaminase family protein [Faecousia sp.]
MKRKAHASKSTYRAILSVQKCRDEPSGLYVSDRFFQPEKAPKPHGLTWLAADVLLLACLAGGLLLLAVSGFSVPVSTWFFPAAFLACGAAAALFRCQWSTRCQLVTGLAVLLGYLLLLFLCQDIFFEGARQLGGLIVDTLNRTYRPEQELASAVTDTDAAEIFLLLAALPAMIWFAAALFQKNSLLMTNLLLFPLLVFLALCGAAKNTAALFLVLLGIVLCMAFSRPKRQRRMWGGANGELQKANRLRFQSVQKKTTGMLLAAFLLLCVPGFFLVRPLLAVSLKPAQQISLELQSRFLTKMVKLLPELSAGAWNLQTEAVGGGVQDGALGGNEGYLLEGVEDLRLTLSVKPKEALFLKGYIGTVYENGRWENNYGTTFDGAALNWNTEGPARLFIQNLPFLRTAFALTQAQSENPGIGAAMSAFDIAPAQLLVERKNANDAYTYLPYGAYLNDYYQVNSGDGAVAGQSEQEDRFFFYFREDMEAVLTAWNALEGTDNVLDRVEESYRAFCETNKQVQNPGMDSLREEIGAVAAENRWSAGKNMDEITSWIRHRLAQNYQYQRNPEAVPDGRDPLDYFLFESKTGNSVHFASAAVVMYRMFGIPARYVVGYEIPASLFSAQSNGTYTATVQGDNAQAWAEIYVPGIGWTPKDMTPGVIGTYAEVGPGGEKVEAVVDGGTEPAGKPAPEEAPSESPDGDIRTDGTGGLRGASLEQIIKVLTYLVPAILFFTGPILLLRHLCRGLGFSVFRRYSRQQRMVFVFQAFYSRMCRLGLSQGVDSQSEEFLVFCERELNRRCPACVCLLRPTVEKLYQGCFAGGRVSQDDILAMRRLLLASYKRPVHPARAQA